MNDKLRVIVIGAGVVVAVVVAFLAIRSANNVGNMDQGQGQYTPGVPPWLDKAKSKSANAPSTPSGDAPVINNGK